MSRRSGRGTRRTGSGFAATAYGLSGFDTTNLLATANAAAAGINNTPLFWAGAILIESQAVASATRYVANLGFSGGTGGVLQTTGTNAALSFIVIDSGVNARTSAAYTIVAGDVGKVLHWAGAWDGSNVWLWVRGVASGAGTACATYLAGTSRTNPGVRANLTLPADGVTWLGMVGGNAVWATADALSHYNACVAANGVAAAPSQLYRWDVKTSSPGVVPTTLPDLGGSAADMTFVSGSAAGLTAQTIVSPVWT